MDASRLRLRLTVISRQKDEAEQQVQQLEAQLLNQVKSLKNRDEEICDGSALWNKWQKKWMMEYCRDGVEKPEDWCTLADMLDERFDCLVATIREARKSEDAQRKEIAALTRKNLEMAAKIEEQERMLQGVGENPHSGTLANDRTDEELRRAYLDGAESILSQLE